MLISYQFYINFHIKDVPLLQKYGLFCCFNIVIKMVIKSRLVVWND
jgi:hypothetical protein